MVAARVAPLTTRIGLVPSVTVTHTEPFHISKAIATLDYVSAGRAGVRVQVSGRPYEARHFGRRSFPVDLAADDPAAESRWLPICSAEAADYVEVLRRLWDSWEDDAEIRDVSTGRFVDREKLHYIDFPGRWFSVKGPSITPRSPQGQPLVAALAHSTRPYRFALASADIVFVTPHDADDARGIAEELAGLALEGGRSASEVTVLADVVVFLGSTAAEARSRKARLDELFAGTYRSDAAVFVGTPVELADLLEDWSEAGVQGFRLRPGGLPHDLKLICEGLVPELQRRSLFRTAYDSGTLAFALRPVPTGQPLHPGRGGKVTPHRQIHLAAHFPGVNNTTVWSDPRSGSHIEFASFVHLAQTAERAKFDFLFLAEGLRLREQGGKIYDLDVVGRPDTFTVLAALAAVTDRLGLAGTINSTFNEPYEVARQFATLDHLSSGRGGLERGHVVGLLHRRELPARRLLAPRAALQPGPPVHAHSVGAVRLLAR